MLRTTLLAFALFLSPLLAHAQEKTPTPAAVMDKYVEATGGRAAYERLKNRSAKGTVEVKGAGLKGQLSVVEAPEAKNLTIFELPGLGKMEQGTDGVHAWERSVINGNKLQAGQEKAHSIRNAYFNGELNWQKVFPKAKVVGARRIEDKECWELEMETPEGLVFRKFFDQKTGLLVCVKVTIKTPQMEIPTETYPGDYQKVDGILYPHEMRMKALQQEMLIRVSELKHNVELPADAFALPKEIKELVEKQGKGKS